MSHPANPFRLVYRSFDRVVFDRVKSDNIFTLRGFDLAYASGAFPGYVLERPATPHPAELRFQALAELTGTVLLLSYTRLGRTCKLLTGWVANDGEAAIWWGPQGREPDGAGSSPAKGRSDQARLGIRHLDDTETRPEITAADLAVSAEELDHLRRRLMPCEPAL